MIETRHYDESDKSERDKGHDYLLRRLLLGERAAADRVPPCRRVKLALHARPYVLVALRATEIP